LENYFPIQVYSCSRYPSSIFNRLTYREILLLTRRKKRIITKTEKPRLTEFIRQAIVIIIIIIISGIIGALEDITKDNLNIIKYKGLVIVRVLDLD
jgi:preprotein translocase subunit Sss1